jgi:hypothetical protein
MMWFQLPSILFFQLLLQTDAFQAWPSFRATRILPMVLFEHPEMEGIKSDVIAPSKVLSRMERAWRYAKKPLLSLGAQKGSTIKHGNSLRELLQQHTMVKVKIQLLLSSSSTEDDIEPALLAVYEQLREHAVQSGASPDMELLQVRPSERTLLVALPGTKDKIEQGTFPPPPPPPRAENEL